MKIKKTTIPASSLTRQYLPVDYTDTFQATTVHEIHASPDDIMISFWLDMPGWVNALFKLRHFIVQFVGLKGSKNENMSELESCIRNGSDYRFVKVPIKDNNETVLLLSDKHLDAYISVQKENSQTIFIHTLVQFHNTLGKVYFFFIKPFHCVIVRNLLKRTLKKHDTR